MPWGFGGNQWLSHINNNFLKKYNVYTNNEANLFEERVAPFCECFLLYIDPLLLQHLDTALLKLAAVLHFFLSFLFLCCNNINTGYTWHMPPQETRYPKDIDKPQRKTNGNYFIVLNKLLTLKLFSLHCSGCRKNFLFFTQNHLRRWHDFFHR